MESAEKEEMLQESVEYIGRIKRQYDSLSKSQKRIANYILNHKEAVIHYSITMMAQKTNTVPSTVTRFCQALSYKGFSELKVYMEKNLAAPLAINTPIQKNDTLQVVLQKLTNASQDAVSDTLRILDAGTLTKTVDAILSARNIIFLGQSGGHISGLYAQQQLRRINILSQAITGSVEMNLGAGALQKDDLAIGIAYSGEAISVIEAMRIAKHNKATVIAITADSSSTMAKLADLRLLYSYNIPDDLYYLHLASMCEIAIIGAIEAEILRRPIQMEKIEKCKKTVLDSRAK